MKPLQELTENMLEQLIIDKEAEIIYGGDRVFALVERVVADELHSNLYELRGESYFLVGETPYETQNKH